MLVSQMKALTNPGTFTQSKGMIWVREISPGLLEGPYLAFPKRKQGGWLPQLFSRVQNCGEGRNEEGMMSWTKGKAVAIQSQDGPTRTKLLAETRPPNE